MALLTTRSLVIHGPPLRIPSSRHSFASVPRGRYEYVICQDPDSSSGVLVLSEFAGAAQTLGAGCVRVNPYNIEELAGGIEDAISMAREQKAELMSYASQYVNKFTAQAWAQSFVASLEESDAEALADQSTTAHALPVDLVLQSYANASRRLILLGVGGTFLPATGATANDDTELTDEQRDLLARLLRDPANTVLLTSGRSRSRMDGLMASVLENEAFETLGNDGRVLLAEADADALAAEASPAEERRTKSWFWGSGTADKSGSAAVKAAEAAEVGGTESRHGGYLWALAESGVFARVGSGAWETTLQAAQSDEWLESVEEVFRYFEERTPGSRVERRDRTIRWAYGAADPELGAQQASNLVEHLEKLLGDAPVERSWEGTCVEVRPHGSSCGHGLMQLLASDLSRAEAVAAAHAAAAAIALVSESGTAPPETFVPRGFDFVLGLGNFSARDEDVFLQLHTAEARPDWEQDPQHGDPETDGEDAHEEVVEDGEAPSEAPPLTLGLNATTEGMRALDVAYGGVYSVILGNRSTHARYYLASEVEATRMLHALSQAPQEKHARLLTLEQRAKLTAATSALANATSALAVQTVLSVQLAEGENRRLPSALERPTLVMISKRIARCWTPAFCLDYDGTLAPLVADPAAARLPPGTRALLREIADRHPTAIVSGRSMEKLRTWVDVDGLYFAGSHGFEIVGPHGSALNYTFAHELLPSIQGALATLQQSLIGEVDGVMIEDNKFALSVHTRNVSTADLPRLDALLETALEEQTLLRRSEGKHVIELRPQVHWHKGRAVEWLLKNMCEQMGLPSGAAERNKRVVPIYIGDDVTDEDAFKELRSKGVGIPIIVSEEAPKASDTAAEFWLRQREVSDFLALFLHDRVLLQRASDDDSEDDDDDEQEEEADEVEEIEDDEPTDGTRRIPPLRVGATDAASARSAVVGATRLSTAARGGSSFESST